MTGANRKGLAWVDPQCREGKTLSPDFAIAANTLIAALTSWFDRARGRVRNPRCCAEMPNRKTQKMPLKTRVHTRPCADKGLIGGTTKLNWVGPPLSIRLKSPKNVKPLGFALSQLY
jgi:hypothetical protein